MIVKDTESGPQYMKCHCVEMPGAWGGAAPFRLTCDFKPRADNLRDDKDSAVSFNLVRSSTEPAISFLNTMFAVEYMTAGRISCVAVIHGTSRGFVLDHAGRAPKHPGLSFSYE